MNSQVNSPNQFLFFLGAVFPLCFASVVRAQDETTFEKELLRFRQHVAKEQFSKVRNLGSPKIDDIVAIAERAERRIFTPENNELRKMARDFETKLTNLLDNDMGRWVAQRPKTVATFIQFDTEHIDLTDNALDRRRKRLAAARLTLGQYKTATQGPFDPRTNKTAKTVLEDANWVEERFRKLRDRLAVIADIEKNFPRNRDFPGKPTLREAKNARIAAMVREVKSAKVEGQEKAAKLNAEEIEKSAFELEVERNRTKLAGDEMLAELERKLINAEYGKKAMEIEKKITKTQLDRQGIRDDITNMKAESADDRLEKYLKSERVRNILAPFCAKGFSEPLAGVGFRRNDSLTKVPMKISRIAIQGALTPDFKGMKQLIAIATNPDNDRPAWSINMNTYSKAKEDFKNMNDEKVNPYIEAQRILREHGLKLVELKIMRN